MLASAIVVFAASVVLASNNTRVTKQYSDADCSGIPSSVSALYGLGSCVQATAPCTGGIEITCVESDPAIATAAEFSGPIFQTNLYFAADCNSNTSSSTAYPIGVCSVSGASSNKYTATGTTVTLFSYLDTLNCTGDSEPSPYIANGTCAAVGVLGTKSLIVNGTTSPTTTTSSSTATSSPTTTKSSAISFYGAAVLAVITAVIIGC